MILITLEETASSSLLLYICIYTYINIYIHIHIHIYTIYIYAHNLPSKHTHIQYIYTLKEETFAKQSFAISRILGQIAKV